MKLLEIIKGYQNQIKKVSKILSEFPEDWQKYQSETNKVIDEIFSLCWEYERDNADNEAAVYRVKRLFMENFMDYFRLGRLSRMVVDKPYGYHGDFFIIDEIYKNKPATIGLERCMDNYFLNTGASIATRNRKVDFINYLLKIISESEAPVRIMDLASGPCRDVKELFDIVPDDKVVAVDCVDHDINAIQYGGDILKSSLSDIKSIKFIQKNAMRIALTKKAEEIFPEKYDVIYSTGLFDYLDDRIAIPLVANLKKLLKEGGVLIISNYRDKWANPSRLYMEWGGGWELIYRTENDFLKVFKEAGFEDKKLSLKYESQKIMQYRFARK